jgi:hypothetical protein
MDKRMLDRSSRLDDPSAKFFVPAGTDLVEWYFSQPWSDGLPVVPPTPEKIAAVVELLGGDPDYVECKIPPRWGCLTREALAINMVLAGCEARYAPVVRAAIKAMCETSFNLNALQASTHVVAPLLVVNGPIRREIGMNADCNVFGSGNRANATIGRAIRLMLLSCGGGTPGNLDKSTLGQPGKYTYCIAENEEESPWAPYHVEHGMQADDSAVFVIPAESPHCVTNHISDDPEGILDSIASAMSTIAHNSAVMGGPSTVVLGPEHAACIARRGWTRSDVKSYLCMNSWNSFEAISFGNRYGKVYNRNLPKWYRRTPEARIPIAERPDDIHLFVAGGRAGRFSAFIPGWGNMATALLRPIDSSKLSLQEPICEDGSCRL